jgi:serine/threonine protein kinase
MKAARNYFFGAKKPTLANEDGWTLTGYGTPKLLEKLYRTGESIGARSVHGTVRKLSNNKFVIKKIPFTNNSQKHSFNTEVKVGSKPRIAEVGTRVFAFRSTDSYGEYIMDRITKGVSVKNLRPNEYLHYKNKIQQKLNAFHAITGGEHGNLHGGNILILFEGNNVKFIDYGAFRSTNELRKKKPYQTFNGMNVYNLGQGEKFIHNNNRLKHIGLRKRNPPPTLFVL